MPGIVVEMQDRLCLERHAENLWQSTPGTNPTSEPHLSHLLHTTSKHNIMMHWGPAVKHSQRFEIAVRNFDMRTHSVCSTPGLLPPSGFMGCLTGGGASVQDKKLVTCSTQNSCFLYHRPEHGLLSQQGKDTIFLLDIGVFFLV